MRQRCKTTGNERRPGRRACGCPAFTLLELLVVVAIVALLLALLLPAHAHARKKARIIIAHSDLRQICLALDAYAMDNGDALPLVPARAWVSRFKLRLIPHRRGRAS